MGLSNQARWNKIMHQTRGKFATQHTTHTAPRRKTRQEEIAKVAKEFMTELVTTDLSPAEASARAFDMAEAFVDEKDMETE